MSFTDSFLDFDAIKNWFENNPNLDMADGEKVENPVCETDSCGETGVQEYIVEGSEPIVDWSKPVVKVEERECTMLENGSCLIEEDIRKVSLVGELGNSIAVGENGTKSEIMNGSGEKRETVSDEDESESSESEIASTSSSSSASSSCSSSDSDDDDNDAEEEKKEEMKVLEVERKINEAGEVEEGEIRDDGQDMPDNDECGDGDGDDDEDVEAMVGWGDVDEEDAEEDAGMKGPIRSKNELQVLPPVPPVDANLLPHHQMLPVGVVSSILGPQVIVEGIEKHDPLSDGSILWISESRSPLGFVDEIFGPVKHPYYIVRYNSEVEVPAGISTGTLVSFVPEFASHILNNRDIYKKGYDASGANDEELSDEEEFSDDEKEAEYKRMQKTAKRGIIEQKPKNSKNNKKSVKNRDKPWKNGKPSPQQTPIDAIPIPPNQHHPHFSPLTAMGDHGNCPTPFTVGQGLVGGTGLAPPLPPLAQAACFSTPSNGVWANSMPFQQPLGAFFPNGFPMNNMPWLSQNSQYPYQMPMPNGLPFNQQVSPNQSVLSGQPNTLAGIPYAQGLVGQNSLNPIAFGIGLQGQPSQPALNVGEQGTTTSGVLMGKNFNVPHSGGIPGNNDAHQQFNPGSSGHGRGSYRRGGGRFARGRGRKQ